MVVCMHVMLRPIPGFRNGVELRKLTNANQTYIGMTSSKRYKTQHLSKNLGAWKSFEGAVYSHKEPIGVWCREPNKYLDPTCLRLVFISIYIQIAAISVVQGYLHLIGLGLGLESSGPNRHMRHSCTVQTCNVWLGNSTWQYSIVDYRRVHTV